MHAVVIRSHGAPEVLEPTEVETPTPGPGEVLVRVSSVSVNAFLDVSNRAGKVPYARYDFPHILGSEHAGLVAAYGPDTAEVLPVGTPVVIRNGVPCRSCDMCDSGNTESCRKLGIIGVNRPGAYAEYTVVPTTNLRPIPEGCTPLEATAMVVNGALGYAQLVAGDLDQTRTVLIQGAGSSAGSMAAIVAKALGKVVIGTVRGADRVQRMRDLKIYDEVVDSTAPDAAELITEQTQGQGIDVVIDNLAAPALWQLGMQVLAPRGRIVTSGAKFGGTIEVDIRSLYTYSHRIIGLRSASEQAHDEFWELVDRKGVRPLVDSVLPLGEVADAHRRIESGENVGRVVLTVP